ncbi:MAG: dihydroneopterin aldolase [Actinobacteria bacterium]|nr:dihydroneopterin aldolase [Actinomycetota bacterium]
MDRITIRGLVARTSVGVSTEERARPQTVVIDIVIEADLAPAGRSDDLADTISYSEVTAEVAGLVASSSASLLEHLAERIATELLARHDARNVVVEIGKEPPPVPQDVAGISVRIERPGAPEV